MRIVAGNHRGRPISAPLGRNTRPTTDRVREGLFNVLCARAGVEGCNVLDAFAGSGALGLEALSRGATHATFYERDSRAFKVLQENVSALGEKAACTLLRADVMGCSFAKGSLAQPFDIVFLDPPYATPPEEVGELLRALETCGALAPGAFAVYEHDKDTNTQALLDALGPTWHEATSKTYGKTGVAFLQFN